MNRVTTTKDFNRVENITHKPKRLQGSNFGSNDNLTTDDQVVVNVPRSITIENAIKFYEENAVGENAQLYLQTSKWLRDLMTKRLPASTGVIETELDIDKAKELVKLAK